MRISSSAPIPCRGPLLAKLFVLFGMVNCFPFHAAHACNVPVFRFALERWRPDPYRVVLFHRGPLSEADRQLIRPLEEQQDKATANIDFRTIDVNSLENAKDREFFDSQKSPQLPWLVARYPEHLSIDAPVWKGPSTQEAMTRVQDSPVRQELVKRLIDGETAVWLFLECGKPEIDDPAAALVESELKKLEKELVLPELTESPDDSLLSSTPLRIAFSMVRVPREEAAEQALIEMLIRSESDLAERSDPLVFPVFGRGRALFALVGAGITPENIRESAAFLVGPCSCQVKELNPGFDLLLAANWDSLLSLEGVPLTAVATNERILSGEPEMVPIPSGSAPAAPAEATPTTGSTAPGPTAPGPAATTPKATVTVDAPVVTVRYQLGWGTLGIGLAGGLLIAGIIMAVFLAQRR